MEISSFLKAEILRGNAILFLGAGASIPATSADGKIKGLSGNQLKENLCEEFLGGQGKNKSLSYISSLITNDAGLTNLHDHIFKLVDILEPTLAHDLIPEFKWKAIITTNYDRVIEKAYDKCKAPLQHLRKIIWDKDPIQKIISDSNNVPLLKAHGCVTRLYDQQLPLILSGEDYHKFLNNRESLFNQLREWATTYPIIFCGYSLSDENIRDLIMDVEDAGKVRPTYIFIDPFIEDYEIRYWSSRRFECLKTDLYGFLSQLINQIPEGKRKLATVFSERTTSVTKLIPSNDKPSVILSEYLETELIHINLDLKINTSIAAEHFYKGNSSGFDWLIKDYDIIRNVTNTLLHDLLENSESRKFFYLLKGYAGSGKSIALKRFAWTSAISRGQNVFYLDEGGAVKVSEILELASLIKERIFIIIDNVLDHKSEVLDLCKAIKKLNLLIVIVSSARTNEWNVSGNSLESEVSAQYDIIDMADNEISDLLRRLTKNNLLGILDKVKPEDRFIYLKNKLKKQLLVALHEITEGKSFEDIVINEYNNISPRQAKSLYLDVCTLNRFNIRVRAGLLSRISGVTFDDFRSSFYLPLEWVVRSFLDHKCGDYVYVSRHDHIAQIVFDHALSTPEEKSYQLIKVIRYLNSSYDVDKVAIEQLVKGKNLADNFANKQLASNIFKAAAEAGINRPFLLHQQAVYELYHTGGVIDYAYQLINEAESCAPSHLLRSIQHTKANVLRRLAQEEINPNKKSELRDKAIALLGKSLQRNKDAMAYSLKAKLLLEELIDFIAIIDLNNDSSLRLLDNITKDIETNFKIARELFPDDVGMSNDEAEYSKIIKDTPRALQALESAYRRNKTNLFISIRLARHYFYHQHDSEKAVQILRQTVIDHPSSKDAHFELAKILIDTNENENKDEIHRNLKKSYTFGDANVEAHFRAARHEYVFGDKEIAAKLFTSLAKYHLLPSSKNKVRFFIKDEITKQPKVYNGRIDTIHDSFAFVRSIEFPENIYVHVTAMDDLESWKKLNRGTSIHFTVGFNYRGLAVNKIYLN